MWDGQRGALLVGEAQAPQEVGDAAVDGGGGDARGEPAVGAGEQPFGGDTVGPVCPGVGAPKGGEALGAVAALPLVAAVVVLDVPAEVGHGEPCGALALVFLGEKHALEPFHADFVTDALGGGFRPEALALPEAATDAEAQAVPGLARLGVVRKHPIVGGEGAHLGSMGGWW